VARRIEDSLHLVRQLGTSLVCLSPEIDTTTATGWFGLSVLAAAAELESTLASERTTAAMRAKLARGERVGRPRSCPDEVLDQVLELRVAGGTLIAIAAAMNESGIPTPAGSARWYASHVSRLLRTQDARVRLSTVLL
jgi:DNA invertase Pin-like site-specific DNA recombinase